MLYENLQMEAAQLGVEVFEQPMRPTLKGLYSDDTIWINHFIPTDTEKACVLAEELGHHHTSVGNIIDLTNVRNLKQERLARDWAFRRLVPLPKIIDAYHAGVTCRHELAEFLGVTGEFLWAAINRYMDKHGLFVVYGRYTICFEPLSVIEQFE